MSGRLPTALLTVLGAVLASALIAVPVAAAAPPTGTSSLDWTANLNEGHPVGVAYTNGALRLTAPTGLLTLPARQPAQPVGRITIALDALTSPGSTVEVAVRGRLTDGRWTEWLPSASGSPTTLPGPSGRVQLRVLMTVTGNAPVRPEVRGLRVHAQTVPGLRVGAPIEPASYSVFATREGLVHGRTANGHQIGRHDLFVALPSWRSLADQDGSEYSVKVCAATGGTCAWAPVWDVGPWNTKDDYWSVLREQWRELPQGVPEAQAAFHDGHNDGKDGSGRTVANPAGIDLSDALFDSALRLPDNRQVMVSYLWTGAMPLSTVEADSQRNDGGTPSGSSNPDLTAAGAAAVRTAVTQRDDNTGPADHTRHDHTRRGDSRRGDDTGGGGRDHLNAVTVRRAPAPDAPAAGIAADNAGVPVECAAPNGWLRIGKDEYLPASAVALADDTAVGPC
ncbi:MAG TPA: hypothetical protein VGD73_07805 [Pseudonocardia sp.]|uniref:hypothetical protein n=1 Tax=Pseudonocardia sp. TaxID=60912 RepID=UPI002EDA3065